MQTLTATISSLPKISKPHIAALKKLGIQTVRDLLMYFPYRYMDFSKNTNIAEMKSGEPVTIQATIKNIENRFSFRSRMSIAEAIVSDNTGSIKIVWFNQGYLAKTLRKGEDIFLSGTPEYYKGKFQLTNPIYEKVSDFPVHTARLVPVYHLNANIYPKTFRNLVASVLELAKNIPDALPKEITERQNLPSLSQTIKWAHFPESYEQAQNAKKYLAFQEIFLNQLLAQKHKMTLAKKQSFTIPFNQDLIKNFLSTLPFQLTPAQKRAAWDILQDLKNPIPMNRLVEGDVGSGKTLVALIAALQTTHSDLQAALLVPTEILARQHFTTAQKYFNTQSYIMDGRPLPTINVSLLTNHYSQIGDKQTTKKKLQSLISEGMPGLFIGTHALLVEKIKFKNLALIIIDEQHRFGVSQRAELVKSGEKVPHLLSLTATPIPRTLQLAIFGELDISTIPTKPAGRRPIITKLVHAGERDNAYQFISSQVRDGRQAFVITPLVEETGTSGHDQSEAGKLGVKAAKSEILNLQKIFPHLVIGLLHGKMKGAEKESVMEKFLANQIHILVATSVVEVGVDIPNASVMVIEGADRFGLSQLHQFRGRVGRSDHQSYCFLFTETENPDSLTRLNSFAQTFDGFALAELDLQQRGFGEIYGAQQSGWNFKYFSPAYTSLIDPARQEACKILERDFELENFPMLKTAIAGKTVHFE